MYKLLDDLIDAYKPSTESEEHRRHGKKKRRKTFEMKPWDFVFYSHKLKLEKFAGPRCCVPTELSKVIDGVFGLANKL